MIMLTRLNGAAFAVNPDLIERAEATPDTVLTLCDGHKLLISESITELVDKVREYRASVVALADHLVVSAALPVDTSHEPTLRVVPLPVGRD